MTLKFSYVRMNRKEVLARCPERQTQQRHGAPAEEESAQRQIGPLTDPTAFGGRSEDAFDVVIPYLPCYAFSGKPTGAGWDTDHIAQAWAELMKRLGYTRYVP